MARIIAVADTFDAITTARPYQNPMSFRDAVKRINELRGHSLDEDVVEAFNRGCSEGVIRLRRDSDAKQAEAVLAVPQPASGD